MIIESIIKQLDRESIGYKELEVSQIKRSVDEGLYMLVQMKNGESEIGLGLIGGGDSQYQDIVTKGFRFTYACIIAKKDMSRVHLLLTTGAEVLNRKGMPVEKMDRTGRSGKFSVVAEFLGDSDGVSEMMADFGVDVFYNLVQSSRNKKHLQMKIKSLIDISKQL